MEVNAKDFILLLAGAVLSVVFTAIYSWWSTRSAQSKAERQRLVQTLKIRLASEDPHVKTDAFHEVIIKSLYWSVLGNIMFAISGLAWVLDLTGVWPLQSVFASSTSFIAVFFFGTSLRWLHLYIKS